MLVSNIDTMNSKFMGNSKYLKLLAENELRSDGRSCNVWSVSWSVQSVQLSNSTEIRCCLHCEPQGWARLVT